MIIVLLPLLPCLNIQAYFDGDWINHLWMMQYHGQYLLASGATTGVYNTTTLIGIPAPLFYSEKFYTLMGLGSIVMGSEIAFRLSIFLLLLGQLLHVERMFSYVTDSRYLPLCIAIFLTWSVYPLTNLYNRSAITEFVAAILFNVAFCSLILFAWKLHKGRFSLYDFITAGLLSALSAAIHPLNALAGGLFFAVVTLAIATVVRRREYLLFMGVNAILAIAVLSPWIYSMLTFRHDLPISDAAINARNFRYCGWPYDVFTNLLSRLSPFPIEFRALMDGTDIPTPHQDAQILLPLLILFCVLYYFRYQRQPVFNKDGKLASPLLLPDSSQAIFLQIVFYVCFVLFGLYFITCIYPPTSYILGGLFDILQFPYRLINYVNLSLITLTFLLLAGFGLSGGLTRYRKRIISYVIVGCLTVSATSLYEKLVHAEAMIYSRYQSALDDPDNEDYAPRIDYQSRPSVLPKTYYAQYAYIITNHIQPMPETVDSLEAVTAQLAMDPRHFGKTLPLSITLDKPSFVITNVEPFPWNRLLLNGVPVEWKDLYAAPYDNYATYTAFVYGLNLPAGKYTLEYEFTPSSAWMALQVVSWIVLALWIGGYVVVLVLTLRKAGEPSVAMPAASLVTA